jgi:hypothetical protein
VSDEITFGVKLSWLTTREIIREWALGSQVMDAQHFIRTNVFPTTLQNMNVVFQGRDSQHHQRGVWVLDDGIGIWGKHFCVGHICNRLQSVKVEDEDQ